MVRFSPEIEWEIVKHALQEALTFETWRAFAEHAMQRVIDAECKLVEALAWRDMRETPARCSDTPRRTAAARRAWRVHYARAGAAKEAGFLFDDIAEQLTASAKRYAREIAIANEVRAELACPRVQVSEHVTRDTERA